VETPAAPSQAEQLAALRQSIRRRETLRVRYRNADGAPSQRDIRPLWLEEHAGQWYLGAYCALRQDERTFRVDRMELIEVLGRRARHGPGYGRRKRMEWPLPAHGRSRANKRASHPSLPFGLPDAPPGSPLVRIWLVEES
jgi:predicted DNA-binding transcriptional regulator YafY